MSHKTTKITGTSSRTTSVMETKELPYEDVISAVLLRLSRNTSPEQEGLTKPTNRRDVKSIVSDNPKWPSTATRHEQQAPTTRREGQYCSEIAIANNTKD
jgi:hypothetical protein